MEWYYIFTWLIIIYAVFYTVSKIFFSIVSLIQVKLYTKKYPHIATEAELEEHSKFNQHQLPVITIVSPAFNEVKSIVESVHYSTFSGLSQFVHLIRKCTGRDEINRVKLQFGLHVVPSIRQVRYR